MMAAGADKLIVYDPPGAIGIVDDTAVIMLRFDEVDAAQRPQDAAGSLGDLEAGTWTDGGAGVHPMTMPPVVDAVMGRGRMFTASVGGPFSEPHPDGGLIAHDLVSGASLLTRDVTIQTILSWDPDGAAGGTNTIVRRGTAYGLTLTWVDVSSRTARIQFTGSGPTTGVTFVMPVGFVLLTATRHWVSPTSATWRYYIADQLIGTETAVPLIGGATIDPLLVGYGNVIGLDWFIGVIDEIMVTGREMCAEEIEATWLRITLYQPRGVQLFREMFDDDFPLTTEPDSDAQLNIRMTGQALGYAAAQIENLRANFLPRRAYGTTLEQWEQAVHVTPQPAQDIEARRDRVEARLRQRRGSSIPGIGDAIGGLVDTALDGLEFIAYSNTVTDGFAAVDPVLWDMTPTGCAVLNAGRARIAPGAGDFRELRLLGGSLGWRTMARPVSQPVIPVAGFGGEHVLAKLVFTTPQANAEAGVWFGDKSLGNYILLGLRDVAGVFSVVMESYQIHVPQGPTTLATLGANPAAIWLHLYEDAAVGGWVPAWSTTSGTAGFTVGANMSHPTTVHWAGCYVRSTAALGSGPVADFDDFVLWTPNGTRPFSAYIYRNPALGGQPDMDAIHSVLQEIKHAFINATVITSKAVLSGDPASGCDRGPMGAL